MGSEFLSSRERCKSRWYCAGLWKIRTNRREKVGALVGARDFAVALRGRAPQPFTGGYEVMPYDPCIAGTTCHEILLTAQPSSKKQKKKTELYSHLLSWRRQISPVQSTPMAHRPPPDPSQHPNGSGT